MIRLSTAHGLRIALLWLGIGCVTTPASAAQSLDAVQAAAAQALRQHYALPGNRVVVKASPLDPRLQLVDCQLPLRTTLPPRTRPIPRTTVQVQCPQAGGWSVRVTLQLQLFRQVLVASHPLRRGDGLRAGDVHAEQRDVTRLGYGYLDNLDQVAGRTLSRALPQGSVLTPAALGGRRMVRAGDSVQITAQMDGIVVRANGVALGSGDNGARLRVRNQSSGKIIDAMVSAPGNVLALP